MKRGRERREREIKNNFLPLLPFGTAPVLPGARRVPGLRDETGHDPVEERVGVVLEPAVGGMRLFESKEVKRLRERKREM